MSNPVNDLSPENAEILRQDIETWKAILAKNSANVLISFRRPDQSQDVTRRNSLIRMVMVLEDLMSKYDRARATTDPAPPETE